MMLCQRVYKLRTQRASQQKKQAESHECPACGNRVRECCDSLLMDDHRLVCPTRRRES